MKVPINLFISGIQARKVYYFSSTKLNTDVPHYFICIKRTDDDVLILSCCTSKFDTVKAFVDKNNLPYSTLVPLKPQDGNPFTQDTYVNCNGYHQYTVSEFQTMYESDSISFSGEISAVYYGQIVIGLHESDLIDEEIKDILPPKQDFI